MNDSENFIERWSRRKREAAQGEVPDQAIPAPSAEPADPARALEAKDAPAPDEIDLAELPSLDSIGADTDVSGFLRPGVPGDMTRAALRRAWSSDPAIRDFVNLVENGHDFNDPDAIPGFGRISADEVSRLLGQAIGSDPFEVPAAEERPASPSPSQEEREVASAPDPDAAPAEQTVTDDSAGPAAESKDGEPEILQRNIDIASQDKPRDGA